MKNYFARFIGHEMMFMVFSSDFHKSQFHIAVYFQKYWSSIITPNVHSSIKMTTVEASKKRNESTVYFNLYGDMEQLSSKPKFKVGDKVGISKYKRKVFDKGYTPNWTEEIPLVEKNPIHKSNHPQIKRPQQRGNTRELLWTEITEGKTRCIPHW